MTADGDEAGSLVYSTDLRTISYLSEAGPSLRSPSGLVQIAGHAQQRNAAIGVTGAIAYHEGRIRQWLEGPSAVIARLAAQIKLDDRHRILWAEPASPAKARHFPNHPMQIALTQSDIDRVDPRLRAGIFVLPETEASLLPPGIMAMIGESADCLTCRTFGTCHRSGCSRACATCDLTGLDQLDAVFQAYRRPTIVRRATNLVALLLGPDPVAALDRCRRLIDPDNLLLTDLAPLLQSTLTGLSDAWMEDRATGNQCQIALAVLHLALKAPLDVQEPWPQRGSVVVSALPQARDVTGVAFKTALLRRAGWSVRALYPGSLQEVTQTIRDLSPDVVVLAGSRMFGNKADLAALGAIADRLGKTSAPPPPIVMGGRLAEDDPHALLQVGATATCGRLSQVAGLVSRCAALAKPSLTGIEHMMSRGGPHGIRSDRTPLVEQALETLFARNKSGSMLPARH